MRLGTWRKKVHFRRGLLADRKRVEGTTLYHTIYFILGKELRNLNSIDLFIIISLPIHNPFVTATQLNCSGTTYNPYLDDPSWQRPFHLSRGFLRVCILRIS